jgi:hypothetical protein
VNAKLILRHAVALLFAPLFASLAAASTVPWSYWTDLSTDLLPVVGGVPDVGVRVSPWSGGGIGSQPDNNAAIYWGSYILYPDDPLFGPDYPVDTLNNFFALTVHFRDDASGEVIDLISEWEAFGTVSPVDGSGVSVVPVGATSWAPVLGGNTYFISLTSSLPVYPTPDFMKEGRVMLDVHVEETFEPVPAGPENPEPATMVLGGLGLTLLGGLAGWRRVKGA